MDIIVEIPLTFAFVENFILIQYFGIEAFPPKSGSMRNVFYYSLLLVLSMSLAAISSPLIVLLLPPAAPSTLSALLFTLISGAVAWGVVGLMKLAKLRSVGSFENLSTLVLCNASVWAIVLIVHERSYSFAEGLVAALSAGIGVGLVLAVLTAVDKRLVHEDIPPHLRKGLLFISAALVALAVLPIDRIFLHTVLTTLR